uniref:Uncharacterized protein n=1 Tax=Setaria italica TaxID=4555 RepID=K3YNQ4_SETIT
MQDNTGTIRYYLVGYSTQPLQVQNRRNRSTSDSEVLHGSTM